jgi:hypothetical protein
MRRGAAAAAAAAAVNGEAVSGVDGDGSVRKRKRRMGASSSRGVGPSRWQLWMRMRASWRQLSTRLREIWEYLWQIGEGKGFAVGTWNRSAYLNWLGDE